MYEGAETEISAQNADPSDMEISDVRWSKVYKEGRKRITTDSSALTAKARQQATTTPNSSLGEVPDLQARKIQKTSALGRPRSTSPRKKPTPKVDANRTPLGERNHNKNTCSTLASQLSQESFGQDENDENSSQIQIPSSFLSESC